MTLRRNYGCSERAPRCRALGVAAILSALGCASAGSSPYTPTAGWRYSLEAAGRKPWPACADRFATFRSNCEPPIILGPSVGSSSALELIPRAGRDTFFVKLGCGRFLSYAGPCDAKQVDSWPAAGINQEFVISAMPPTSNSSGTPGWSLRAVGRARCPDQYVSFPSHCAPDQEMVMAASPGLFRLQVVGRTTPMEKAPGSASGCADPFAWYSVQAGAYFLVCTGGNLALYTIPGGDALNTSAVFQPIGEAIGGKPSPPPWAASGNRWAPENLEFGLGIGEDGGHNVIFVADDSPQQPHRIGWVMSMGNVRPSSWTAFSPNSLNLGQAKGGEIDAHVFRDSDGKTYLVWKTDDNSVGLSTTRLWGQEMNVSARGVSLVGRPRELMDSTGMWWVTSWVNGGSLVEGPEVIKHGGFYYLFFAGGRYCQDSYSEGVARSTSIWGPYVKMQLPLLSTALVGMHDGKKLIGPGHASFVAHPADENAYYIVYHASVGENCNRYAFVQLLRFDAGWPYVEFDDRDSTFARPRATPPATASGWNFTTPLTPPIREGRLVAPCASLAPDQLPRWSWHTVADIPTARFACPNNTRQRCVLEANDGSGAQCGLS